MLGVIEFLSAGNRLIEAEKKNAPLLLSKGALGSMHSGEVSSPRKRRYRDHKGLSCSLCVSIRRARTAYEAGVQVFYDLLICTVAD